MICSWSRFLCPFSFLPLFVVRFMHQGKGKLWPATGPPPWPSQYPSREVAVKRQSLWKTLAARCTWTQCLPNHLFPRNPRLSQCPRNLPPLPLVMTPALLQPNNGGDTLEPIPFPQTPVPSAASAEALPTRRFPPSRSSTSCTSAANP